MNKVKEILKAFWEFKEDYDGEISCRKVDEHDGYEFYKVKTDGNDFDAAICLNPDYEPDKNIVFFASEGCHDWSTTDGTPAVVVNGIPRILDFGNTKMSVSELAYKSGKTVSAVYKHAKKLGRLPTLDELKNFKSGRPKKY